MGAGFPLSLSDTAVEEGVVMDLIAQYHAAITAMLQKIVDTQKEAIQTAARRCARPSPRTGTCT